jgi:DNA-binding transcriptional LysR family regulator
VTLLHRTSRRVDLTQAGETLLGEGKRLLADADRVVGATRRASSDTLKVGFYGSAAALLLTPIMQAFSRGHPSTVVTIHELLFGRLDAIADGGVDVAFTRLHPDQVSDVGLEGEVLAEEPRLVVVASDHRLAGRAELTFADLCDDAFIVNPAIRGSPMTRWRAEQRRHGLAGRVAAEAESLQELLAFVAVGRGVSLVPASVADLHPRPDVTYLPVRGAEPALVTLVWSKGRRRPVSTAFIAIARERAVELRRAAADAA